MAEYVVLIVGDADRWWTTMDPEQRAAGYAENSRGEELTRRGHRITGCAELHATSEGRRHPRWRRAEPWRGRSPSSPSRWAASTRSRPTTSTTCSSAARSSRRSATASRYGGSSAPQDRPVAPVTSSCSPHPGRVGAAAAEEHEKGMRLHQQFHRDLAARGHRVVVAGPLTPSAQAVSMRPDGSGGVLVTDGPFTESVEQVVGLDLLETDDRDDLAPCARRVREPARFPPVQRNTVGDEMSTTTTAWVRRGARPRRVVADDVACASGRRPPPSSASCTSMRTARLPVGNVDAHGCLLAHRRPSARLLPLRSRPRPRRRARRDLRPVRGADRADRRLLRRRAARPRHRDRGGRPAPRRVHRQFRRS